MRHFLRVLEINLLFLLLQYGGRHTWEAEEMYERLLQWYKLGFSYPWVERLLAWEHRRRSEWLLSELDRRWYINRRRMR